MKREEGRYMNSKELRIGRDGDRVNAPATVPRQSAQISNTHCVTRVLLLFLFSVFSAV